MPANLLLENAVWKFRQVSRFREVAVGDGVGGAVLEQLKSPCCIVPRKALNVQEGGEGRGRPLELRRSCIPVKFGVGIPAGKRIPEYRGILMPCLDLSNSLHNRPEQRRRHHHIRIQVLRQNVGREMCIHLVEQPVASHVPHEDGNPLRLPPSLLSFGLIVTPGRFGGSDPRGTEVGVEQEIGLIVEVLFWDRAQRRKPQAQIHAGLMKPDEGQDCRNAAGDGEGPARMRSAETMG